MASSAAAIRKQIESDFEHRYPSALTSSTRILQELVATGIDPIDELLQGGLPVGAISEITGPTSSGRTSIALAFVAGRTREGGVCAWVDVHDSLDPESAAANGICLKQLLWVRCGDTPDEQTSVAGQKKHFNLKKSWTRLDQAIRATDLLLQAGGFAAIVLDLGDERIEHGRRIPLATWFRFRQASDRTRCTLIVLGKASFAQSSAAAVVECQTDRIEDAYGTVIRNFSYRVQRGRVRFSPFTSVARKPPASTWSSQATWNPEKHA